MNQSTEHPHIVSPDANTTPPQPLTISSESLMQGRHEIQIRHGQDIYRLRLTRNGKLILQK